MLKLTLIYFQSQSSDFELENLTSEGKKIVNVVHEDDTPPEYHAVLADTRYHAVHAEHNVPDGDEQLPDYHDDCVKKL